MSTTTFTYKNDELVCLGERYPAKTLTISTKCDDLNTHELLDIFKSFMLGCGYAEKSFYDACYEACQEHPCYRQSGNGSKLGETNETKEGYQDHYKYPTGM